MLKAFVILSLIFHAMDLTETWVESSKPFGFLVASFGFILWCLFLIFRGYV